MAKDDLKKVKLSPSRMLSRSWELFTSNFQAILVITLLIYIPVNIILALVPVEESWSSLLRYYRIARILEGLIGIIATMAIAYLVHQRIEGKKVDAKQALKKAVGKWPVAIGTSIMLGIFLLGLTLLLIVPGIIYYFYWYFVLLVVVLRDLSWKDALDYSKGIVLGRWWTVFGYLLAFGLISVGVALVFGIVFLVVPEGFVTEVFTSTILDIALSYFTVLATVFFINFDATKGKPASKKK